MRKAARGAKGKWCDSSGNRMKAIGITLPIIVMLGYDPIWFGIVLVKLVEISVVTPPVGMNLFAVMSAVDDQTRFSHVARGVMPFIGLELIVLALLVAFPELVTWLPQKMLQR